MNIHADAADAGDRVELMIPRGCGGLVRVGTQTAADRPAQEAGAVVYRRSARPNMRWSGGLGADAMIMQGGGRQPHRAGRHHAAVASVLDAVAGTGIR